MEYMGCVQSCEWCGRPCPGEAGVELLLAALSQAAAAGDGEVGTVSGAPEGGDRGAHEAADMGTGRR
jgi:hypothetical protein